MMIYFQCPVCILYASVFLGVNLTPGCFAVLLSLYTHFHLKMACKKRFSVSKVLSQLFDTESDIEENVSETEDIVEEDPHYEASSSEDNETLGVDPSVVSQPPADTLPSKNGKLLLSLSPLERQGAGVVLLM